MRCDETTLSCRTFGIAIAFIVRQMSSPTYADFATFRFYENATYGLTRQDGGVALPDWCPQSIPMKTAPCARSAGAESFPLFLLANSESVPC